MYKKSRVLKPLLILISIFMTTAFSENRLLLGASVPIIFPNDDNEWDYKVGFSINCGYSIKLEKSVILGIGYSHSEIYYDAPNIDNVEKTFTPAKYFYSIDANVGYELGNKHHVNLIGNIGPSFVRNIYQSHAGLPFVCFSIGFNSSVLFDLGKNFYVGPTISLKWVNKQFLNTYGVNCYLSK